MGSIPKRGEIVSRAAERNKLSLWAVIFEEKVRVSVCIMGFAIRGAEYHRAERADHAEETSGRCKFDR
jgi:hypothetical protein